MKRALLETAVAALLSLAMASAQTPKPDEKPMTIVGCLVQGKGAPNPNDYFVRTPTVELPVGATVAVGKPGTTSTATSAGKPTADSYYRITGMDREQLRPHVGHRVEVQGHLSAAKADTTAKTTVDAAGKPKVTVETRADVAGNLHATALKMVSPSCQ